MTEIELLDDTDHKIKGDPHFAGDWQEVQCPYCGEEISEIWDYGLNIYKPDDAASIDCPKCDLRLLVVRGESDSELYTRKKHPGLEDVDEQFVHMLNICRESLKRHTLVRTLHNDGVSAFYMKRPEARMMSVYLIMTPEGIVITGDLCPGHGVVSNLGYDVHWFSGQLSKDYLCEKFPHINKLTDDHAWLVAIQERFAELYQELYHGKAD